MSFITVMFEVQWLRPMNLKQCELHLYSLRNIYTVSLFKCLVNVPTLIVPSDMFLMLASACTKKELSKHIKKDIRFCPNYFCKLYHMVKDKI